MFSGIDPTALLPQGMIDAVKTDFLTPISTNVKACDKLLNDETLDGQAIEYSADRLFFFLRSEYLDDEYSMRATTV